MVPGTTGTNGEGQIARPSPCWSPERLLARARWSAREVVPLDGATRLTTRRYELLERTDEYESWVIFWPEGTGLLLHDHGGSAGAFHVVAGTLEETSTNLGGLRLRRRTFGPGASKSFGPAYVHSLVNPRPAPATTVHAYSPPLTSMRFYAHGPTGLALTGVVTDWEGAPPD